MKNRVTMSVLLVLFLAGVAVQQPGLVARRDAIRPQSAGPIANASPLVTFSTVALGGLNGLLIDILWARVTLLQERAEYLEIAQLSDWITKLEPRLSVVWDFHSFNLAYNVSSMSTDPSDRWRWIESGIELLRDKALVANPDYLALYDRLCRIYRHKLIEGADPAQPYYRYMFARQMDELTDSGAVPSGVAGIARLAGECRLDATLMRQVDADYGPLDWRLPEAHVLYWAAEGRRRAAAGRDLGFDYMICDTLASSFLDGKLTAFHHDAGIVDTSPDMSAIPRVISVFTRTMAAHGYETGQPSPFHEPFKAFVRTALLASYQQGLVEQASSLQELLRDKLHEAEAARALQEYARWISSLPVNNTATYQQVIDSHHHDH